MVCGRQIGQFIICNCKNVLAECRVTGVARSQEKCNPKIREIIFLHRALTVHIANEINFPRRFFNAETDTSKIILLRGLVFKL